MPSGKGTYGKKVGRPPVKRKTGAKPMKPAKKGKKRMKKSMGLTAAQKKLPPALRKAIMKKKRGGKKR